jgi:hypothetical protein
MVFVDLRRNKLILKVVLAGPPAVGKSERLAQLGAIGRRQRFGSSLTGETELAALPIDAEKEGRGVEIEVYEWHGPERADLRAKALFVGLDGIIYLADAREDRRVDTIRQFEFLVEKAGKSKVQRLSALLLLGHLDEGLLRLSSFEGKLQGPTWSERLELPIEDAEPFVEAVRLFGETMLARVV